MLRSIFSGGLSFSEAIMQLFSVLVIIFLCFPLRECARGYVAKALGDDTAERSGMLTLNPLVHIDWMGAIAMLLCGIGWSKPVPISLPNCRKVQIRTANLLVALAGPVANILMAFIFMIIYRIIIAAGLVTSTAVSLICYAILMIAVMNVMLAVFNLLPIPPFNGYQIISTFLPTRWVYAIESKMHIISLVVMILLISGLLSYPISLLSSAVVNLLFLATSFIA